MAWKNVAESVQFDVIRWGYRGGVDIGCGANKILPHYVGMDSAAYYDDDANAECERADLFLSTCDETPMFADGAFQNVFSSHLLDCVAEPAKTLMDWWRLVRHGGNMILHLQNPDAPALLHRNRKSRSHHLSREGVQTMMMDGAKEFDLIWNEERTDGTYLQVYRKHDKPDLPNAFSWSKAKPEKTVGIMRPGAQGDALWAASVAHGYKKMGYHVTMYQSPPGATVVRCDPNVDEIIEVTQGWFPEAKWIGYYGHEATKYDKFINLIGSVETNLLPHNTSIPFYWPHAVRHKRMNVNYLEATHEIAELPLTDFNPRFYPTKQETDWAVQYRIAKCPGPMVVLAPTGSNEVKTWPYTQQMLDALHAIGVYTVILGEIRQSITIKEPYGIALGVALPIRLAMTLAGQADVVVGIESAILNSVAMEDCFKVALMFHSSAENLTKHWKNTATLEPQGVECYPCHRIHEDFTHCHKDVGTGMARCQSWATPEMVLDLIVPHLKLQRGSKAA